MILIRRNFSGACALALACGGFAAACTQDEGSITSVAYYRSHPREWERAVWVCTNDGNALEHTLGCANALQALREADVGERRKGISVSASDSPRSMVGN